MGSSRRDLLNNTGVKVIDEPFHHMRNRIIVDLRGSWKSSSYWNSFRDQQLLSAVMRTMERRGELIFRLAGDTYEWSVPRHVLPRKIAFSDIPK